MSELVPRDSRVSFARRLSFEAWDGDEADKRLVWVARYFVVSSGLLATSFLSSLAFVIWGPRNWRPVVGAMLFQFGLTAVAVWSLLYTAKQLRARRRSGAYMALVSLALPFFSTNRGHVTDWLSVTLSAVGLVALASVWRELE